MREPGRPGARRPSEGIYPGPRRSVISTKGKAAGRTSARTGWRHRWSGLRRMLMSLFYVGKVNYQREALPGSHPPIIEQSLFHAVQEALRKRARS